MKLKINSCGVCDCAPEWQWHTMGFSDYDLWAVFRGSGTIRPTSHGEISVHDGTCILLTPNTEYTARHDPEYPLLVITVHFDFLNEFFSSISIVQLIVLQHGEARIHDTRRTIYRRKKIIR